MADEIIARHGGSLTIDSEQGVGTTVMITLPFIEQEHNSEESDTVDVELISSDDKPDGAVERKNTDEQ